MQESTNIELPNSTNMVNGDNTPLTNTPISQQVQSPTLDDIALPNTDNFTTADSSNVEMAKKGISGKVVKEVVLPSSTQYQVPSYLVDLRKVTDIHRLALNALKSLVQEEAEGNIPVYLYVKESVVKVGYGNPNVLYSTLKKLCKLQFNADVYLNDGDGFKELEDDNVFGLRLSV
jgi:hypothetical protein